MAGATVEGAEPRFPVFAPETLIGAMETVSLDVRHVALDPDIPGSRCEASSVSGLTWRNSSDELKAYYVQRSMPHAARHESPSCGFSSYPFPSECAEA